MRDLASGPARVPAVSVGDAGYAAPGVGPAPVSGERIGAALERAEAVRLARAGLGAEDGAWIVGGAVREAALGHRVGEVDLALAGAADAASARIARAAGGHAFELSGEFGTWRVAGGQLENLTIDVAELRGPSIEADLALRDFTINAVAVPLSGGAPLDPSGGLADLERGLLRAVSERSFTDDPLRVLRAVRFASGMGLEIDPETVRLAREEASRAGEPAGERQLAELGAMVAGPDPVGGIELLDVLGATPAVLPELDRLRGVAQSANHHLDAHGHTIEVLRRTLEVEGELERYAGPVAGQVAGLLDEPLADGLSRRDALRFAALLHDIGKPDTRTEHDGWVSFKGHDAVGAEMIGALCTRLRTSRRLRAHLAAMTRDHLVLGFMVGERPLPARRVWGYLRRTGAQAVDTTLLTVADRLSAQGGGVPAEAIEGHVDLAREILVAAVAWEQDGPADPLLRGNEIAAEVGIAAGPELGAAVRELEAAQYGGELSGRAPAIAHLRAWRGRQSP